MVLGVCFLGSGRLGKEVVSFVGKVFHELLVERAASVFEVLVGEC